MDPPADHGGGRRTPLRILPSSASSNSLAARTKRETVGTSYVTFLLGLSALALLSDLLINNRILSKYSDPSIKYKYNDQPSPEGMNLDRRIFHPTALYKHILLRQSNNQSHAAKLTFDTGGSNSKDFRITFQLHDPKTIPLKNLFNPYAKCPLDETRDGVLPPSLTSVVQNDDYPRGGRVLDFTATISTNLKILQIGDSVLVQLAQAFDEMVACRPAAMTSGGFCRPREKIWEAWRGHDGRTIIAPTIGGGVSAMWRMTALLSKSREGKAPANSAGGGWSMPEVISFLNHSVPLMEGGSDDEQKAGNNTSLQRFDAVIFRVMHGWMKSNEITHDRLVEAVKLAHELLGAETVVLMTIPFTNNVLTAEEMNIVNHINEDIREIAQGWHLRKSTGAASRMHVLVLEYGAYIDHITWSNARNLGYNVSAPLMMTKEAFDAEGPTFLYDKLETGKNWKPTIAMVCSELNWLGTEKAECKRNYLIRDGMHICPETLAARYGVAVACVLGCVYNRESGDGYQHQQRPDENKLRACERECNEQFMSVMPVDESWVDSNTELASFAID